MKKTFEYDLTKYSPDAPTRTEEFLTADGVKTLTTDANDGAVLIQDSVDKDSLNPVTAAAVSAAIEGGGGGSYTAGDGISIAENEISAKVDGTTIGVNASGELEALGGGGSSYTAGAGISIDGNGAISVVPDSTTVKVERPLAVYATKDSFYGRMSFSDTLLGTATSSSTCTFGYGLNTDGAAFKIGCDSDQIGCEIRVEIGNDSNFTKSVISTVSMAKSSQSGVVVTLTDTETILEGYGLSFYRGMGSPTYTFSNTFDWSEYTFDEIFGNSSVYVRLRAWDSTTSAVVGNVLRNPTSTGPTPYVSANMSISSDAIPPQVMVKFDNVSYSGLTTNRYGLAVANPGLLNNTAGITDIVSVASLPASPDAHTLYLVTGV